jgi:hypothetical protein
LLRSQVAIAHSLRSHLKHLPPKVVRSRLALVTTLAIQAVALRRVGGNAEELSALTCDEFLTDLSDSMAGMLMAPSTV